ncbi:DNA-binding NarL/FixJ family response regulator [Microbacterium testaceum]|nr:DNA-binding NarL/FixJ family response regulator [Microbacterium testaceum]
MTVPVRIVLVDDQSLFRAGIRMVIDLAERPRGRRRGL